MRTLFFYSIPFLILAGCATNQEAKPRRYFGDNQSHPATASVPFAAATAPAPVAASPTAPAPGAAAASDSPAKYDKVASYQSTPTVAAKESAPAPQASQATPAAPAAQSAPAPAAAENPYQALRSMPSKDAQATTQPNDQTNQPQATAPAQANPSTAPAQTASAAETSGQPQAAPANNIQDRIVADQASAPVPANPAMKDLFDRWERVWNQGQYDLIAGCLGPTYTRHDEYGNKTVSSDAYAKELRAARDSRPHIQFEMYEHSFDQDRAWFRFNLKWNDKQTGAAKSQAGLELFRTENGKIVETWLTLLKEGTSWPDKNAQPHWTSSAAPANQPSPALSQAPAAPAADKPSQL